MPRKALRCAADITVHTVTCPGVWLPRQDEVYLRVRMFGQVRRTQLTWPRFPLLFHDRFRFDKVFSTAFDPSQVADHLEVEPVTVELVQISDYYDSGRLLAEYSCTAKDFLYPYPSYSTTYGTQDREILMDGCFDFPGISPKLQFSTKSIIKETTADVLYYLDDRVPFSSHYGRCSTYSGRPKCRSSKGRKRRYGDPTIASISRSRSISPSRLRLEELCLDECLDDKPPFVVRKVEKDLIGRIPGTKYYPNRRRASSPSRSYAGRYYDDYYTVRPSYSYAKTRVPYDDYYYERYSEKKTPSSDKTSLNALDLGMSTPRSRGYGYASSLGYPRPSTGSAYYRSSLSDRFGDLPYSPTTADIISSRVDRAIKRHRSLENLTDLGGSYGRTKYGGYEW